MSGGRADRTGRQTLVGVLIAVCVTSQLATLGHLALVPHSFCAVHGEAVDLDVSTASALAARHPPPPPCEAAAISHDDSSSDAHDHCLLAIDRAGRVSLSPSPGEVAAPALGAEPAGTPPRLAALAATALLLLAPKTSPPA